MKNVFLFLFTLISIGLFSQNRTIKIGHIEQVIEENVEYKLVPDGDNLKLMQEGVEQGSFELPVTITNSSVEQNLYTVILDDHNNVPTKLVAAVRKYTELGVADALNLVKSTPPVILKEYVSFEEARAFHRDIAYAGGISHYESVNPDEKIFFDERDNIDYRYIEIDGKIWLADDLAYLPSLVKGQDKSLEEPRYYVNGFWHQDEVEEEHIKRYHIYGALYNWTAALSACPDGWYLPSNEDWNDLIDFAGGKEVAGGKLKEVGTDFWDSPNEGATNELGFNAKGGGTPDARFKTYGVWWTANENGSLARYKFIKNISTKFTDPIILADKQDGLSVRCIKGEKSVESISLNESLVEINAGDILPLFALFTPVNATNKKVEWTSLNSNIAVVDDEGNVTGLNHGKATIVVTTDDGGLTAECVVYVKDIKTFIDERDDNEYSYATIGNNTWMLENLKHLPEIHYPADASSSLERYYVYEHDYDQDVESAVGSHNYETYGVLYNLPAAKTACPSGWHLPTQAEWDELFDEIDSDKELVALAMKSTSGWNSENGYDYYGFNLLPGGCNEGGDFHGEGTRAYMWIADYGSLAYEISSDIEHYDDGGHYGFSVRCVKGNIAATSISISKSAIEVEKNEEYTLVANVLPEHASNKSVVWISNKPSVAKVDQNVVVTGVGQGTAVVTAMSVDGEYKATCAVTVYEIPVTGISLSQNTLALVEDEYVILEAIVSPENATNKKVIWSSSNSSVVKVISNGRVDAVGVGSATITAMTEDGAHTAVCVVTVELAMSGTFKDQRDGKTYSWVRIGNQIWMAENLAHLPSINKYPEESDSNPMYYVYGYEGSSVAEAKQTQNYITYGVLYNWKAAENGCPNGWRLPKNNDWIILADEVGGIATAGVKLKSTTDWQEWGPTVPGNGTDDYGFTALPAGEYSYLSNFGDLNKTGWWWSDDVEGLNMSSYRVSYGAENLHKMAAQKDSGHSVRCIKE